MELEDFIKKLQQEENKHILTNEDKQKLKENLDSYIKELDYEMSKM